MLIEPVEMASIGWIGALLAEPHDRALAELLFDLADGHLDGLGAFAFLTLVAGLFFFFVVWFYFKFRWF